MPVPSTSRDPELADGLRGGSAGRLDYVRGSVVFTATTGDVHVAAVGHETVRNFLHVRLLNEASPYSEVVAHPHLSAAASYLAAAAATWLHELDRRVLQALVPLEPLLLFDARTTARLRRPS